MIARTLGLALLIGFGTLPAPADAQRRRIVEIFGNDPCPSGTNGEIIVCAKRPESDRFRIPTEFRGTSVADATTQEDRVGEALAIGRTGTDSCSPVGPGGHTGCFVRDAQNNRAARRQDTRDRENEPR